LIMAVLFVFANLNSCSEEDDTGSGPGGGLNTELTVEGIILNPKSPGPSDTLFATAIVTSDTTIPGDFASYSWSADGGSFLETDLSTVRWIAPNTSAMFTLSVTVGNNSSTKSASENVFVNEIVPVVSSDAGGMRMSPSGDSLYFFSSPVDPTSPAFDGFGVSVRRQPGVTELMAPSTSFQLALSRDFSKVAFGSPFFVLGGFAFRVHYRDLTTQVETIIPSTPFNQRGPQYTESDFSPDVSLLTYQVWFPDVLLTPAQGGVDTFVVAIWDLATETEKRVGLRGTTTASFGLNFHPTFSNDANHLVYMSDPGGTGDYELYALPVVGGTVPVDTVTPPTQLTFSGGVMGAGVPPNNQPKLWNPSPATADRILATRDVNGKLRLVPTDGSGDILVNMPGSAVEFAWSPSGQDLMVTNGSTIYRVDKAGGISPLYQAISGDNVSRLSWSSDEKLLLYAIRRGGGSWYEVIDLSGTLGFTDPLKVTPSASDGGAGTYADWGSIAPVWDPSDPTAYLLFFDTGPTPSISKMSFSGLLP
jgi:hypothetical protein